jgi:hypothetical protein
MKKLVTLAVILIPAVAAFAAGPVTSGGPGTYVEGMSRAVLYDQSGVVYVNGRPAQNFEAAYDAYDCWGADDFTVPGGDVAWEVADIYCIGSNTAGIDAPTGTVEFYTDGGGIPGTLSCSSTSTNTGDGSGGLVMALDTPCTLPAATYWVAVQVDLDYGTSGQWFWQSGDEIIDNVCLWQNPGDGFGTGCTTWGTIPTCLAGTESSFTFVINGEIVPVELQSFSIE